MERTSEDSRAEALNCLSVAILLKRSKNLEKAKKIYIHALALSPENSEVLNRFGEFIEETERDILEADEMYRKALIFSEIKSKEHTRAIQNRKRTSLLVDQ